MHEECDVHSPGTGGLSVLGMLEEPSVMLAL